ncbi:hypothetical protein KCP78_08650 [Salmonella enterica subsp. enterica]|nr:hypothetical protein KCP78_08650 [Salmonella enterica subsp. enterica]
MTHGTVVKMETGGFWAGRRTRDRLLRRLGRIGGRTAWACAGLIALCQQTGDSGGVRKIIVDWFAVVLREARRRNVNTMAPFLTLAYRYETRNQRIYRGWSVGRMGDE